MKARASIRLALRQHTAAELCGVPLTEWLALPRRERKRRLRKARSEQEGDDRG